MSGSYLAHSLRSRPPSNVTPKFVSPSDPAAQWTGAMRGPAFFAYANNYLIDVKFGVIMDVEASRASANHVSAEESGGEYFQVSFDSEAAREDEDSFDLSAPSHPYLLIQRQFEDDDGGVLRTMTAASATSRPTITIPTAVISGCG